MPSTVTYTNSSGSGEVRVYPAGVHASRSPSVHSPTSSDSRSSSNFSDWTHLSEEDDIEPSESASRPRHKSRRHTTEVRPAPTRRYSRQVSGHHEEEPPRHRSHRHRPSRHQSHEGADPRDRHEHREARRHTSDSSSAGTVDLHDDYPYGRHGGPPQHAPFPPTNAYRHGTGPIPPSHGGYPPSMPAPQGYGDPFQAHQALVTRQQQDPFNYPPQAHANPFATGPPSQQPYSPAEFGNPPGYFPHEPQHPAMSQHHRPGPPSHRSSMYGPAPGSIYSGSELVPSPYGYPGMHAMPHMAQGYPVTGQTGFPGYPGYPPSHHASPAPPAPAAAPAEKEKEKEPPKEEKKDDSMLKEMEALRALIKQQEEERIAREKAIEAAELAKKLKAEQEAEKSKEIAAASAAAKAEAEKAAEDAAKKAKEESDKKLAEAEAAKVELEKKQKDLEEVVKKNTPLPDMQQSPIKFKDAVGRTFKFPWHLCKTWKGMEALIKQAFLHVDVIGQHVQEGHYDLMGPDGEIILPQVWDTMIKPDWEVSMHMWPIPETPKKEKKEKAPKDEQLPLYDEHGKLIDAFANMGLDLPFMAGAAPVAEGKPAKKGKKADGKKAAKRNSGILDPMAPMAPMPPVVYGGSPPAPAAHAPLSPKAQLEMMMAARAAAQNDPMVVNVVPEPAKKKPKKKELSGWAAWMAGGPPPKPSKKDDEKLELSAPNLATHSHSQSLFTVPVPHGNAIARRRRSTAGSSWTSASASASPPAKNGAAAEQASCAVM